MGLDSSRLQYVSEELSFSRAIFCQQVLRLRGNPPSKAGGREFPFGLRLGVVEDEVAAAQEKDMPFVADEGGQAAHVAVLAVDPGGDFVILQSGVRAEIVAQWAAMRPAHGPQHPFWRPSCLQSITPALEKSTKKPRAPYISGDSEV